MSVAIYDSTKGAFVESDVKVHRDGSWIDTQGYVYQDGAWVECFGSKKVRAKVYGAVEETVTIKKNGVIISTVQTNSLGESASEIELPIGTYTLVGSVSGYEREQVVDVDTAKFMAMPDGALYWYGNECSEVTGGWLFSKLNNSSTTKNTNSMTIYTCGKNVSTSNYANVYSSNSINFNNYNKLNLDVIGRKDTQLGGSGCKIDKPLSADINTNSQRKKMTLSLISTTSDIVKFTVAQGGGDNCYGKISSLTIYNAWLE